LDIKKILEELRQELEQLEVAILSLERLALSGAKRRGRPPSWMVAAKSAAAVKRRGRPAGSKNRKPATKSLSSGSIANAG
jgi:D-Tyr-tRNAtyr deacylase